MELNPQWSPESISSLTWPEPSLKTGWSLLPVVVQHYLTGQVLMLGYMDKAALQRTLETQKVVFFSRSKGRLWMKGETSGAFLNLISLHRDCDADTLLAIVDPQGPTCHRGSVTCFDSEHEGAEFGEVAPGFAFLGKLMETIESRASGVDSESYTYRLLSSGLDRVLKKVGEEAGETIIAAKNLQATPGDLGAQKEFQGEAADLLFHLFVTCQALKISVQDVVETLRVRENMPRRK